MVTHIDDVAIAGVGTLYTELGVTGRVLDLMSSWISHFDERPEHLAVLGMNEAELQANEMANEIAVQDLNATPTLPWPDAHFDDAVCVVSVDYLTQPLEVFCEVARVLRPNGRFITTFSNRCFPTKAIRGWMQTNDRMHCEIVAEYFRLTGYFNEPVIKTRVAGRPGDPLFAVWGERSASPGTHSTP